jgi:hypothetical protein
MSRQVRLNLETIGQAVDKVNDSDPLGGIRKIIRGVSWQRALKIDLKTTGGQRGFTSLQR